MTGKDKNARMKLPGVQALQTAKERFKTNERKIDARLERIQVLSKELDEGRRFVEAWPEREKALIDEVATNRSRCDGYMKRRDQLSKDLTHEENKELLSKMQEQIARLKREISCDEKGQTLSKAEIHHEPSLDLMGTSLDAPDSEG